MSTGNAVPIAYFNTWSTAHGGSSTSLIDITRSLDRERFAPLVVCPEPGALPDRLQAIGVPVYVRGLSRWRASEAWWFLREGPGHVRFLRSTGVRLLCGNTTATRRSLLQAARLSGIPYIQHVRNPVRPPLDQVGYRYAARIITNSHAVGAPFWRDPALSGKTITIYNAVDLSRYEAFDDRRAEIGAGDCPIVGFVGQLIRRKGLTTLIQAMAEVVRVLPNAMLIIVGCAPPGKGEYEADCRALVTRLDLAAHVRFVGYRDDVPAWMRTFDVFALPTHSEPFGKVVIEAMAAGKPVVVSRVGGLPEIVTDDDVGLLIEPYAPHELARAILSFLENTTHARQVGAEAARSVRARFGLTRMIDELQAVYAAVLEERRGKG